MMTAKEIRERSQNILHEKHDEVMNQIEELVMVESGKGNLSANLYLVSIPDSVLKVLRYKGFNINLEQLKYNEFQYVIKW